MTDSMEALKSRLKNHNVPSLSGSQLSRRQRLSEGVYGTVYIADAHGLPDYGRSTAENRGEDGEPARKLVAVKFLPETASQEEK